MLHTTRRQDISIYVILELGSLKFVFASHIYTFTTLFAVDNHRGFRFQPDILVFLAMA